MRQISFLMGLSLGVLGIWLITSIMPVRGDKGAYKVSEVSLPKDTITIVKVDHKGGTVQDAVGTRSIPLPKFGDTKITVKDSGAVVVEKEYNFIETGVRPHAGIAYTGKVEPMVAIQCVRIEDWELGVSGVITPSLVGISLDKDISSNALAGLGVGISGEDMQHRYFIYMSVGF
jgi:hypothetical protein